jgi:hypothetical protein
MESITLTQTQSKSKLKPLLEIETTDTRLQLPFLAAPPQPSPHQSLSGIHSTRLLGPHQHSHPYTHADSSTSKSRKEPASFRTSVAAEARKELEMSYRPSEQTLIKPSHYKSKILLEATYDTPHHHTHAHPSPFASPPRVKYLSTKMKPKKKLTHTGLLLDRNGNPMSHQIFIKLIQNDPNYAEEFRYFKKSSQNTFYDFEAVPYEEEKTEYITISMRVK